LESLDLDSDEDEHKDDKDDEGPPLSDDVKTKFDTVATEAKLCQYEAT
jgi:hypothetical protein